MIPSTSTTATTGGGQLVQPKVQLPSSNEDVIDKSTPGNSVSKNTTVTLPVTDQLLSLPVATGPSHVGTAGNVLSVETSSDIDAHVEMENGHVHVETQSNDQHPPHVETTTADQPVTLHVHVETPNIVHQNTESVEQTDTQGPVQKSTKENKHSMLLQKSAKLILKLLKDIEIDVWCNKTLDYHRFVPPLDSPESPENTGYSLCVRKPKVTANGLSLRRTNSVNYAPMLDSDADDSDGVKKTTPIKIRPKLDGPSTAVIHVHAHIQNK